MKHAPKPSCSLVVKSPPASGSAPDFAAVDEQLRINKYVTLQLLWEEYRQTHPEGYRYSRFCELYQRWRSKLDVVLRQDHKAGERMFVDWAGATIPVYDRHTGQPGAASLFVATLGASSYTWAEATRDQQMESWLPPPTASWIGSFTTLIASTCAATRCARNAAGSRRAETRRGLGRAPRGQGLPPLSPHPFLRLRFAFLRCAPDCFP
ncbi:MAG: transposase [Acidobacteria bacterium]|nr:transposase [Acidobacteriota bacterium]